MHGEWVGISVVLTKKILKDFHTWHPEMSRMKALVRSYTYWPGMNKDMSVCSLTTDWETLELICNDRPIV